MRIAWITRDASAVGGAERYVFRAARLLAGMVETSILFYDVTRPFDVGFASAFQGAFPLVDIARQIPDVAPDLIFLHQWPGRGIVEALLGAGVPVVRFLHDHRLFCLREHKVTALGQRPCTRTTGLFCYLCPGFVRRSRDWPGMQFATLLDLDRERAIHARLDALLVPSAYLRDHAVAHGLPASLIQVLPPPVDPPAGTRVPPRDPDRILYVGALTRGKGLDVLLEAMERLPASLRLTVVGQGPQEPWFRRKAAARTLRDRVAFVGRLDPEALDVEYRSVLCLVVPSRQPETFGLVGPEALIRGTPVIASRIGGVGEWLQDGVTGLAVPACDPAALARAIRSLRDDPERARALGEAGRALVAQRFRPDLHRERLMNLLSAVAARNTRGAT